MGHPHSAAFRISEAHLAGDRAVCELAGASANGFNQIGILVAAAT
jgi:hypothetical protein